jgi:transposase
MRRISVELRASDRQALAAFRFKGTHPAREVNRAHILAGLDRGLPDGQIAAVLGVSRVVIWRTRSAFADKGLAYALHDGARSGAPRQYGTDQEAEVVALACQQPPLGCKRWTLETLTSAARERGPKLAAVSRETIRRWLKKTS